MSQNQSDVNATAAKQAWSTPTIESYDVAQFTLGANGGTRDAGQSQS